MNATAEALGFALAIAMGRVTEVGLASAVVEARAACEVEDLPSRHPDWSHAAARALASFYGPDEARAALRLVAEHLATDEGQALARQMLGRCEAAQASAETGGPCAPVLEVLHSDELHDQMRGFLSEAFTDEQLERAVERFGAELERRRAVRNQVAN